MLHAMHAGLPYAETRRRFAELLVSSTRRLVLPLIAKNRMLSARLAWSRLSVHVVQLLNWAFTEVREDMLPLYVSLAWDLMPLLSSSCSSHTLQGKCQIEAGDWSLFKTHTHTHLQNTQLSLCIMLMACQKPTQQMHCRTREQKTLHFC